MIYTMLNISDAIKMFVNITAYKMLSYILISSYMKLKNMITQYAKDIERLLPMDFIKIPLNKYPVMHASISRMRVVYRSVGKYLAYYNIYSKIKTTDIHSKPLSNKQKINPKFQSDL
eukprot:Mrub_02996.p3 GENE.Mrub_02996~~Mrub_02996.p3  ORF type:complete len:117 (-),score=3.07 Mrub_02996:926-1276(-)